MGNWGRHSKESPFFTSRGARHGAKSYRAMWDKVGTLIVLAPRGFLVPHLLHKIFHFSCSF
ncbi:hypothetical protein Scep_027885 [Stephania cephalantha]|uniref:Uncharacterized protein n=1 Tax=Stephania cephalantha TaxID=152367 RepID=A0AAP0EC06_9MAGN